MHFLSHAAPGSRFLAIVTWSYVAIMSPFYHRATDRIETLDTVYKAARRLVNWFRHGSAPSALAAVQREQIPAQLLELAMGRISEAELDSALSTLAASADYRCGDPESNFWPPEPCHCGGCASIYEKLISEVIDLAISTNPSESLVAELKTYDHLTLAEFKRKKSLGFFSVDSIFRRLERRSSSAAYIILARLRAEHEEYMEEMSPRRADLKCRVETAVSELANRVNDMPAQELRLALESIFVTGEVEVNSYISRHGQSIHGNIFDLLQSVYQPALQILPAALSLATSTKDWPLISTLLVILREESHAYPELMTAALQCKKSRAVLELINRGAQSHGPPSPPPAKHLDRMRQHAEYNEALRRYCNELEAMNPQDRLRRIAEDDQWPLAALPPHYADTAEALQLPDILLERLMTRLERAPRGPWANLRSQVLQ